MLKLLNGGNNEYRYKGYCTTCKTNTTFNESQYCNQCSMHYVEEVNHMNSGMGSFTAQDIMKEREYNPEVPQEIIDELTNYNQEPAPKRVVKNTKNKFKKQNFMKKSIINFGKNIAKGTCKTLGGIHFVVQTTADAVAATEALIRERAFHEDRDEAFVKRKVKTANYQLQLVEKFESKIKKEDLCVKNA